MKDYHYKINGHVYIATEGEYNFAKSLWPTCELVKIEESRGSILNYLEPVFKIGKFAKMDAYPIDSHDESATISRSELKELIDSLQELYDRAKL